MITKFKIYENNGIKKDKTHADITIKGLQVLAQMRIYHWQSEKLGQHNVYDEFIDEFAEKNDELNEIIQGIYGRVELNDDVYIPIKNIDKLEPLPFLEQCIDFYQVFCNSFEKESEVTSIIDEIIAGFQRLKYLLSFK